MPERGSAKIKGAVEIMNDTLGVNTLETLKNVLESGITGAAFGKDILKNKTSNTVREALGTAHTIIGNDQTSSLEAEATISKSISYEKQIETIKNLKELLDADILTQEEFEVKKKEILGV